MAFVVTLFPVIFILMASMSFVKLNVYMKSEVSYRNGQWVGDVACHFLNESECAMSIHSQGRRIDVDTCRDNENVFISCLTSNTSIVLTITNVTYDDIQEYACLNDATQKSNHTSLDAYPVLELVGIEQEGALVRLTCTSFVGAPLYWILPGSSQDHKDAIITNSSNSVNSSTTAVFTLKNNDNLAEYKCCIKAKPNQASEFPCASHIFIFGDAQLTSTSADLKSSSTMIMTCVYIGSNTPNSSKIDWLQCSSSSNCYTVSTSYYTKTTDEVLHTLNTTLKYSYSSSYPIYKCRYNGVTGYTFNINIGTYTPKVAASGKDIYYSNDGYGVILSCSIDANPQPIVSWIKTDVLSFANGSEVITNGGEYFVATQKVSSDKWISTLTIFPYDINRHNSVYTCKANNTLGSDSIQMNSNEGPVDLDLKLVSLASSLSWQTEITADCTFKTFPHSQNYDIIVTTVNNTTISVTDRYVKEFFHASVAIRFQAYTQIFPATVECIAFNRFNSNSKVTDRIVITAANLFTAEHDEQLQLPQQSFINK